ncbi:DgyrCDS11185 [Dimorphilus gyrociliatus]|uniref:DgyrCDS11185 n=1 Tax=Dimorphilus gyrociliatus TaxID=2664684 RepID=A0A7I8W2Q2_9ANNE|nr:DgyrCDS11185 [Dimorphilus gyrociliatus]
MATNVSEEIEENENDLYHKATLQDDEESISSARKKYRMLKEKRKEIKKEWKLILKRERQKKRKQLKAKELGVPEYEITDDQIPDEDSDNYDYTEEEKKLKEREYKIMMERERIAHLEWAGNREREEYEKKRREEIERRIRLEYEEKEKLKSVKKRIKTNKRSDEENDSAHEEESTDTFERPKKKVIQKHNNMPPPVYTNSLDADWRNPTSHEMSYSSQSMTDRLQLEANKCNYYWKTGVCRFGNRCSRFHPRVEHSNTLIFHNMYYHFELEQGLYDDDYNTGVEYYKMKMKTVFINSFIADLTLEYEYSAIYKHFMEFYQDSLPEFKLCGRVLQFKVCCNYEPHLRGNVYVQYDRLEDAITAYKRFNGRWYAGRQLSCEFSHLRGSQDLEVDLQAPDDDHEVNGVHTVGDDLVVEDVRIVVGDALTVGDVLTVGDALTAGGDLIVEVVRLAEENHVIDPIQSPEDQDPDLIHHTRGLDLTPDPGVVVVIVLYPVLAQNIVGSQDIILVLTYKLQEENQRINKDPNLGISTSQSPSNKNDESPYSPSRSSSVSRLITSRPDENPESMTENEKESKTSDGETEANNSINCQSPKNIDENTIEVRAISDSINNEKGDLQTNKENLKTTDYNTEEIKKEGRSSKSNSPAYSDYEEWIRNRKSRSRSGSKKRYSRSRSGSSDRSYYRYSRSARRSDRRSSRSSSHRSSNRSRSRKHWPHDKYNEVREMEKEKGRKEWRYQQIRAEERKKRDEEEARKEKLYLRSSGWEMKVPPPSMQPSEQKRRYNDDLRWPSRPRDPPPYYLEEHNSKPYGSTRSTSRNSRNRNVSRRAEFEPESSRRNSSEERERVERLVREQLQKYGISVKKEAESDDSEKETVVVQYSQETKTRKTTRRTHSNKKGKKSTEPTEVIEILDSD